MRAATIAAMPNAHSHAFQRDLRGLGERNPDDFWSWRTQMMHLAQALDPESMQRVATQVYGEMLAAGYGAVGEFHYVHHEPDGTPYDEPNALALAVAQAAIEVGLRDRPHPRRLPPRRAPALPRPRRRELPRARRRVARVGRRARRRLGRRGRALGARRAARLAGGDRGLRLATTACRATSTPPSSRARCATAAPSTAPARSSCSRARASSGPRTSVMHAIHVDERDVALLADSDTIVVTCPTTEGNLGDGHLPALAYRDAGRAAGDRLGLAGARRPVRGDARARDRRAPRGHHAPRAARPPRRPVGRAGPQRPGQPRPARAARRSTSTSSTPICAASAATSWRSRWRRAPRPASSAVRPAACAPAAAACRSGRPAPGTGRTMTPSRGSPTHDPPPSASARAA